MSFVKNSSVFAVLLFLLIMCGCSSQKTEKEQYEDVTSGFTYTTYKTTSSLAVAASIETYNMQQPDSAKLEPVYAHLLLGYFWSISGKPSLAFAEAEITETDEDPSLKYLAQSLRSITMYQQGWHTLAKEESIQARQNLTKEPGTTVTYEAAVFYLIMGTVCAKDKDFAQAKFFWAGFGNETGVHWPYQVCDAVADLQGGRVQEGLQKIKVISQDPAGPPSLRAALAIEIEKIEKHAGTSVDSSLFWPGLIAGLVWDELQHVSDHSLQKLIGVVNDVRKKLPV